MLPARRPVNDRPPESGQLSGNPGLEGQGAVLSLLLLLVILVPMIYYVIATKARAASDPPEDDTPYPQCTKITRGDAPVTQQ